MLFWVSCIDGLPAMWNEQVIFKKIKPQPLNLVNVLDQPDALSAIDGKFPGPRSGGSQHKLTGTMLAVVNAHRITEKSQPLQLLGLYRYGHDLLTQRLQLLHLCLPDLQGLAMQGKQAKQRHLFQLNCHKIGTYYCLQSKQIPG